MHEIQLKEFLPDPSYSGETCSYILWTLFVHYISVSYRTQRCCKLLRTRFITTYMFTLLVQFLFLPLAHLLQTGLTVVFILG